MNHFAFLYRLIFFIIGLINILYIPLFIWKKKEKIYTIFLVVWIAMTITGLGYVLEFYLFNLFPESNPFNSINLSITGTLFLIFLLPRLIRFYFGKKWGIVDTISLIITSILFILIFIDFDSIIVQYRKISVMVMFSISNIYCIILIIKRYISQRNNRHNQTILIYAIGYSILFPLLFLTDMIQVQNYVNSMPDDIRIYPLVYAGIAVIFVKETIHSLFNSSQKEIYTIKSRYGLSPKECEVAILLAEGKSYKEIANKISVSVSTVNTHVMKIYRKTKTHNKMELQNLLS